MPIIRHGGKIVYFAHVPKCGGTSVETFLQETFGEIGFFDGGWRKLGPGRWSATSPQHIELGDLGRLFAPSFFDASFCVVRHPAKRFLSAFNHNRLVRGIPWYVGAERFLGRLERAPDFLGRRFDNHFLPACRLVPEGAQVFRQEDGFDALADWLRQTFALATLDAGIGRHNKKPYAKYSDNPLRRIIKKTLQPPVPALSPALCQRIHALYREDYDRFGYAVMPG